MLTKNLLIGGVATVGTVATAVVVTNQYGTPFSSKTNDPKKENKPPITVHSQNRANGNFLTESSMALSKSLTQDGQEKAKKDYREAVKKWLNENIGDGKWKITIRKDGKDEELEKSDVGALPKYLTENTESLKLLAPEKGTTTTFVFENILSQAKWKIMPSEGQITAWVKKASGNKATLKLADNSGSKELGDIKNELDKLFEDLSSNREKVFEILKTGSEKNILFEKIDNDWKHSKTEIDNWLKNPDEGNNDLKIEIKKDESNTKTLDLADENDLIGLLKCLKDGTTVSQFRTQKMTLTFQKNGNWNVVSARS